MTDWDQRYQDEDTPWDKGSVAPPLIEFYEANPQILQGDIVVPGCGRGHDVRYLAGIGLHVTGLDISPTAIALANELKQNPTESYALGDFLARDAAFKNKYDWLFEHTCLCALNPTLRSQYVEAAYDVLKPEGQMLAIFFVIVENADPDSPPYPISSEEIDTLFHPYFETLQTWIPSQAYPGREGGKEEMRILRKKG